MDLFQIHCYTFQVVKPSGLLKTHKTGVISDGHDMFSTYIDFGQYAHDLNLTMNILLKTLLRIAKQEVSTHVVNILTIDTV